MKRRKFLIGTGALAAGSAAAIGSGAFSNVQAERDVTVTVEDDDGGAYLGLEATSGYAENSGDGNTLSLTFDDVNWDATTSFYPLFDIINNGQNEVAIKITNGPELDDVHLHWFIGETGGETLSAYEPDQSTFDDGDPQVLGAGEDMPVGMYVSTGDADLEAGNTDSPFDRDATITIQALTEQEV